MDVKDLIEYASQNPGNQKSVDRIMAAKFQIANKKIVISKGSESDSLQYTIDEEKLVIRDLDLALKFVCNFCRGVTNIMFSTSNFNELAKSLLLISDISEYCTKLIEIELPPKAGTLITKPFYTVKIVTIQEMNNYEDSELNRVYPSMVELRVGHNVAMAPTLLAYNHPKLKKFVYSSVYRERSIERIILQNMQIDTLEAKDYPSFEFLRRISLMPNIKTFIVKTSQTVRSQKSFGPIYFSNIMNLTIINDNDLDSELIILPLIFNNLKSFNYRYTGISPINNGWFGLVPNRLNLKDISMPDIELSTRDLIEYSTRFPNLESITFEHIGRFRDPTFIAFLAHTYIAKITLTNVDMGIANELMQAVSLNRFRMKAFITNPTRKRCTLSMEQTTIHHY